MVKVYISADLEGINGVFDECQLTVADKDAYEKAIDQMHLELNAVIKGLQRAKAELITINDSHTGFQNVIRERLPENIHHTSGFPRPISMMYELNKEYDCVFLFGYHCMAGTPTATLAHTFNLKFRKVILNNKPIGEAELNCIYAGLLGIPVAFATGDDLFCEQIKQDIGLITTVTTKQAKGFNKIIPRNNKELLTELEEKAQSAIENQNNWVKYLIESPYRMEIEFKNPENVPLFGYLPLMKQVSENSIEFGSQDYSELYKILQFISAVSK